MSLPHPSPIERHILDLLDRIERRQADRITALEERVLALETENKALKRRSETMEAELRSQEAGITAFSASLDAWLDPPDLPPA